MMLNEGWLVLVGSECDVIVSRKTPQENRTDGKTGISVWGRNGGRIEEVPPFSFPEEKEPHRENPNQSTRLRHK